MSFTAKFFNLSAKLLHKPLRLIGFSLAIIKKPTISFFLLPIFGKYLFFKTKAAKKTARFEEKIILLFTNRYIIHILLIAAALTVTTSNILAYETREDYGKNALINKLIGLENSDTIEDARVTDAISINSYIDQSRQLTRAVLTENQQREEALNNQDNNAYSSISQGGSTLIKPNLPSGEASVGRGETKKYLVAEGDTISSIASRFAVSIDTILWANNLSATGLIRPGQTLTVPPVSGVLHQIVRGDTLQKIAQKYQVEEARIKEFNLLDDNGSLIAGQTIMVPGGRIIYTQRPRQYEIEPIPSTRTQTAQTTGNITSTGRMIWPSACHRISQYFKGWRHTGVDIACPWGGNVLAADSGVVVRVQYGRTGYGYNIIISHGNGKQTLYGHLSRILVEPGQRVTKGAVIGLEGSTGRSTGPHLHFEVRIGDSMVNPLGYIR